VLSSHPLRMGIPYVKGRFLLSPGSDLLVSMIEPNSSRICRLEDATKGSTRATFDIKIHHLSETFKNLRNIFLNNWNTMN